MKGTIPNKKVRRGSGPLADRDERLGTIAHDINNAFSPILMAVSLLRPKVADERGARILALVAENAKRGGELVGEMQAILGRGEGGRSPAPARPVGGAARPRKKARRRRAPGGRN